MRIYHLILAVSLLLGSPLLIRAAETPARVVEPKTAVQDPLQQVEKVVEEEGGVPLKPVEIGHIGKFPITNSMLLTWIVAFGIIIFAQVATRNPKQVPEGAQNFWEWMVESLHKFLENIIGHELVKKTFWFFATIFIFILFCNWAGLIPGVGTVGWGVKDAQGHFHLTEPFFRGANADLNMTFAMALIFFACWIIWALQANGIGGVFMHIFGAKGHTTGWLKILMIVVFALVGVLEVVSILFRPVSLSFRLYGNVYAGESMLEAMAKLVPSLAWLIPIPFYFLEIIVGLVQALVFMLLTAVFTLLITQHDESHAKAHH
ncbi:MAG TPA: F0F1 ATP synthase subunit A [Verrucomicrobiae bacterium]|jgi:F-type H+-transporting ATPase subunit a